MIIESQFKITVAILSFFRKAYREDLGRVVLDTKYHTKKLFIIADDMSARGFIKKVPGVRNVYDVTPAFKDLRELTLDLNDILIKIPPRY